MGFITVGDENSTPIELYYEDQGTGQPVVLIHGYPLNGHSWERQTRELLAAGVPGHHLRPSRVRAARRRSAPATTTTPSPPTSTPSWRPSTCATSSSSDSRWARASSPATSRDTATSVSRSWRSSPRWSPSSLSVTTTPTGCRRRSSTASRQRRGATATPGTRSSSPTSTTWTRTSASGSARKPSPPAGTSPSPAPRSRPTPWCPRWIEDFRADVEAVRDSGKPALILHGTADNILPIDATARRFRTLLPDATYVEVEGAPHGLLWTHADDVNAALREFLG